VRTGSPSGLSSSLDDLDDGKVDRSIVLDIFEPMTTSTLKDVGQVQRWFHALSDETRLRLLDSLREGEQCVCDLTGALDAAQSRLSFHLKTLKDAGLVTDRRQGRWVYYALNPEAFEALTQVVADMRPRSGRLPARCRAAD
jgi:ArsR family transcriptional regulator